MRLDFAFYVGGLEKSILALLKNGDTELNQPGMTGVKEYATYSGELNREDLIIALKAIAPRFPLVLVAYGSGKDRRKAATGLDGGAIEIEHTCGFVVIVASNDARNEEKRRTTAYKMVGEARQLLGGVQFEIKNEGEDEYLNHTPLIPVAVETIVRLPDLTAYAAHFETSFHEFLPDRRVVAAGTADEILLDIEPTTTNQISPTGTPGVYGETNE